MKTVEMGMSSACRRRPIPATYLPLRYIPVWISPSRTDLFLSAMHSRLNSEILARMWTPQQERSMERSTSASDRELASGQSSIIAETEISGSSSLSVPRPNTSCDVVWSGSYLNDRMIV